MGKVAIVTDSNSGITQEESKKLGIHILPMPFYINGELFYEDITLSQEEFYKKLAEDAEISTSQPSPGDVMDLWEELLKKYAKTLNIRCQVDLAVPVIQPWDLLWNLKEKSV